jgi:hypothetical protein
MRSLSACSIAALLVCLGCSGGPSNFCTQGAASVCKPIMDCCTGAQREKQFGVENTDSIDWCVKDMTLTCETAYARQLYAVEKGTATYNSTKAQKCFDAYKRPGDQCTEYLETSPFTDACKDDPFEGKVATGGDCHWDFECSGNAFCSSAEKCTAYVNSGEDCTNGKKCNPDPEIRLTCTQGKCAAPKGLSEACLSSNECAKELYCETASTQPQCKTKLDTGTACTQDGECVSGDCLPGTCANGISCTSDSGCFGQGHCTHTPSTTCTVNSDCGRICSTSFKTCVNAADCTAADGTCGFDPCVSTCNGRVCASKPLELVDYCPL